MGLEHILANAALTEEIADRLSTMARDDPRRRLLAPERLLAASEAARSGKEAALGAYEEAIILREARPVFMVRNSRIEGQLGNYWQDNFDDATRARVQARLPSVGKIILERHPRRSSAGTAWLVAEDVLVTNRHVAELFLRARGEGFVFERNPHDERVEARIDFRCEHDRSERRLFQIDGAIHIEPVGPGRPDVALLRVSRMGDDPTDVLPSWIELDEADPDAQTLVGVVGYSERDDWRNDLAVMERIYGAVYGVKRFQPGLITRVQDAYLNHDCSTLGGSSGGAVLSFKSGKAVGLHFSGYYEKENFAVKASTLLQILHTQKIENRGAPDVAVPKAGASVARVEERRLAPPTATALRAILSVAQESSLEREPAADLTPEQFRELVGLVGQAQMALDQEEREASDLGSAPDDDVAARLVSWLRQNAMQRAEVNQLVEEVKYDNLDLRWGLSLLNWLRGLKPHPLVRPTGGAERFANTCEVAIAGDWGSGLYGAPVVASSIEKSDAAVVIHLGDVYYAGTEQEIRENFLKYWPMPTDKRVSRALNSNHEMYSGGYGYFNLTLPALKQSGSYFAIQNEHYTLVGLDTGYHDFDIDDEQLVWLHATVQAAGERRVILMSHHQLFEPGEAPHKKLLSKLSSLLHSRRIFAWYWGHVHAAVLYEQPHAALGFWPRCIGHSGFPYFRGRGSHETIGGLNGSRWRKIAGGEHTPNALLLDDPNPYVEAAGADPARYGAQGYLTLSFDGPSLRERLRRPDGTIIHDLVLVP